ncbi:MAG: hypothetical protein ICV70_03125, partial [Jiangellaceae bacterium]|nr:hypothetical protein [Jiangellaceae bacterium]
MPKPVPRGLSRRIDDVRERLARRRAELEAETDLHVAVPPPPPQPEQVRVVVESAPRRYADHTHPVPQGVRAAADWAWRLLVIVVALALVGWLAWEMRVVVFPVVTAALLSALLFPLVRRLRNAGWNRGLS